MRFSALSRRAVHAVREYFSRDFDVEAMLNMDRVAPFQRRHLTKVYMSLFCVSANSTLGSYCTEDIGSYFALCGALMSFYCFYLISPWHETKRVFLLSLGAYFGGAIVSPWVTWFLDVDAGFTVTLLTATSVGFGCYWIASKWTDRFEWVYFRALLLCSPLVLICLHISASVFGGDSAHWEYQLYPLVLWYMVYVALYSQEVVLRSRRGESDYVKHAIRLFTDFPSVVIHNRKLMREINRLYR